MEELVRELTLYPKQQWVISLNAATFDIFKLNNLLLDVHLKYFAFDKPRKIYSEKDSIDFNDYRGFIIYISETDELKEEVKNMSLPFAKN